MSAFAAAGTFSQSSNGKTVTFYDISDYTDNSENYTVDDFSTREILLYNADDTLLDTLVLEDGALSADYEVTTDFYIKAILNLVGINPVPDYSKDFNCPLQRNTDNKFDTLLKYGCACDTTPGLQACLNKSLGYMYGASRSALYGNGPAYDNFIGAAQSYLSQF